MEEKNITTGAFALRYGLIYGGIAVAFSLMLFFMDMHYQNDSMQGIVSMVIMAGTLLAGMIAFRKANDGFISLGEALKVGVGASLIGALLGVVYHFILTYGLDPEATEKSLDYAIQKMKQDNPEISQEILDQTREMQSKFSSPWIVTPIIIIFNLFLGFIISLIGGLIVKRSRPE